MDTQEQAQASAWPSDSQLRPARSLPLGKRLQAGLEKVSGKPAAETITLPWLPEDQAIVAAGAVITREQLDALNDAIQHRLSDIEDTINREQENVRA